VYRKHYCRLPLSPSLRLYSPWTLAAFFSFLIQYTVGRTPWKGDQPVARPQPTHRTTQTQHKRTQTSMPRVRLEATIPMLKRAKTHHALDRAATVIGLLSSAMHFSRQSYPTSPFHSFNGLGPLACSHYRINLRTMNLTDDW
jgi:hypothetical protein